MTERAAGRKNTTQFVFAENSMDILRLFAALQIAITHYLNLTMLTYGKDGPGDGLLLGFKRALTLFPGLIILFTISGFLMGETLMRTQNRKIFAQKRILRLYPALWVNIVLTIGLLSLLPGVVSGHGKDLLIWAVVQGVGLEIGYSKPRIKSLAQWEKTYESCNAWCGPQRKGRRICGGQ